MKPDVIVTWPENCDFPIWRRWIAEERDRFAKVIVAFSPTPGLRDLRGHTRPLLEAAGVSCIDTRWADGWDWRDAAVNAALNVSDAKWVWFTEPDFEVINPEFWELFNSYGVTSSGVVGVRFGEKRWHPCCLLARRNLIEQTDRYFGSEPVDHFYAFGCQLNDWFGVHSLDLLEGTHFTHMAGLSHNHTLVERGEPVTYKPDEFAAYLQRCLERTDDLDPSWIHEHAHWLACYH